MAKPPTAAEKRHMGHVAGMPCIVCQAWPVEVHHVVGYADRAGRLSKRHDRVIGLCSVHHRTGKDSVHSLGHSGFYDTHGVDLMAEAEKLHGQEVGGES